MSKSKSCQPELDLGSVDSSHQYFAVLFQNWAIADDLAELLLEFLDVAVNMPDFCSLLLAAHFVLSIHREVASVAPNHLEWDFSG